MPCFAIQYPSYNDLARRAEYSLTESALFPFQAEPTHTKVPLTMPETQSVPLTTSAIGRLGGSSRLRAGGQFLRHL